MFKRSDDAESFSSVNGAMESLEPVVTLFLWYLWVARIHTFKSSTKINCKRFSLPTEAEN